MNSVINNINKMNDKNKTNALTDKNANKATSKVKESVNATDSVVTGKGKKELKNYNKVRNETENVKVKTEVIKTESDSDIQVKDDKKEELIKKLKDCEEQLKLEKESKRKSIESKNKEIENKEKLIVSIAGNNKKLINELEYLKKEVDDKLDKISIKDVQEKERELERQRKERPIEQVLKVKEKELKNTMGLLNIVRRDYKNLENQYIRSEVQKLNELENKLKEEENKNLQLEVEIKMFNKLTEEHKKCENQRDEYVKEKKTIVNELQFLKNKNKNLQIKMKEDEEKPIKANERKVIANNKLPDIDNNPKTSNRRGSKENIKSNSSNNVNKNTLLYQKKKFAISLQNKNFSNETQEQLELFNQDQKAKLLTILSQEECEALEKKFEILEQSKLVMEKKYKTEGKQFNKKIDDLEERLEYTQLQNKEAEQRNKILSFQINEYRNENRNLQKKLHEHQVNLEKLNKNVYQKEKENISLTQQLQNYQKKFELNADRVDIDKTGYNMPEDDEKGEENEEYEETKNNYEE
jgi:hypothetical protein